MPDRREALTNISKALREQAHVLQALNRASDHDIPQSLRLLLDAIDHIDVAVGADRPVSPGTYIRLTREGLGLTVEQVASMVDTDPDVSAHRRAEWLVDIEGDAEPISDRTALVLHDAIGVDLRVLAHWIAIAEAAKSSASAVLAA